MAKKKVAATTSDVEAHPLLLKIREESQNVVTHFNNDKKLKASVAGIAVVGAMVGLVDEFGCDLEGATIPDGFFDGLDQRARRMALMGIILAVTCGMEE